MISGGLRMKLMLKYIEDCKTVKQLYEAYYWSFSPDKLGDNIELIESAYKNKMLDLEYKSGGKYDIR